MLKEILGCLLAFCIIIPANAQQLKDRWVDSVFNQMSLEDKIGQIFMVRVSGDLPLSAWDNLTGEVETDNIGGVVFTDIKNANQAHFINRLQSVSRIPLLIGAEAQTGLGISLDSAVALPPLRALSAIANDSLIFSMGHEMARQMKLMGINLNFIPASAGGPNAATFGENRHAVAAKSLAYWMGLQAGGVLACAKYFPVQGLSVNEVQKDNGLPSVNLTVDSLKTYPFKVLIKNQIPAIMPASPDLPLFYSDKKTALKNNYSSSSLSTAFAGEWLKQHLNFAGLMMVDVERMAKTSSKFSAGEAELFSFQAGNDILITGEDLSAAIRKMKKMLRKEKAFLPQLDNSVKKILALKYDAGLAAQKLTPTDHLVARLVTTEARLLQRRLHEAVPTVIANQRNTLPVQSLESKKFICIAVDDASKGDAFAKVVSKYVQPTVMHVTEKTGDFNFAEDRFQRQQVLLVAVFPGTKESTLRKLIPTLKEPRINREVIICDFGSGFFKPYAHDFQTLITAYTDGDEMLNIIPQVIFGGLAANGVLPVGFGAVPAGTSANTPSLNRLTYSFPEDAGMDAATLDKIEAIANEAIALKATPGCQVLIAKDGKVIYEKSFGHLTYEKQTPVTDQTIYDLASVTKVTATLQTTMFLYERGLIDLHKKASVYLPELRASNKRDFTLKEVLTHQAGLWPGLPFWAQTMKDTVYLPEFYRKTLSPEFPLVVSDHLYASPVLKDSLWRWVVKAKVREKPERTPYDYRYSDLGFYVLHHLAERLLNQPIEDFLSQNLYEPLGAYTTGYLPLLRYPVSQIAPTENDKLYRKSLLIGTVHDQGAAMQGGVAGHAGLFSTANDLAKLYQMLLQEGNYGGLQYYRPETVRLFSQRQFESSRRGLGWDKPVPSDWNSPTSLHASPKTFGHTGFTGTCVWVDPEFNVVYIFLSNRVHPDMTNNKLLSANIRSRIQDVIYQSIFNYCRTAGGAPQGPLSAAIEAWGKSQ